MLAALLSTLLVLAGPKPDLGALEGSWTVDRMEQQGKKFPTDLVARVRLEINGDEFLFINGKTDEFTAKVTKFDPSGSPRSFDLTRDEPRQTIKAIYKLDGDVLTVCTNARGVRPTEFATDPRSANVLTVYRRGPR